jgi:hypothetical protein
MQVTILEVKRLLSSHFSWTDINYLQGVCEVSRDMQGPQNEYNSSDTVTFQNITDRELVEVTVMKTNV